MPKKKTTKPPRTARAAERRPEPTDRVSELREKIRELTDREPDSDDPRYLAQRLGDLEKRIEAGEDVRHRNSGGSAVISVSMPVSVAEAVGDLQSRAKLGASELVRRAIALWARENGFASQAKAIEASA